MRDYPAPCRFSYYFFSGGYKMNVLLIDDDRFVVAALQKKIDWASLSVSEIFSAYNIRQAKKIMEDNSIRICVCDIEMPGGSGLELLAGPRT